ncbi:GNAT family N-acetyltransferase [Chelatococcus sp. GCM10030263]|uniref:GNAT family N-acetyltransferase n=1 Tax=Chelatococcus sp. GCM10030263 TaxID=3273387 RepID=UPI003606656D
MTPFIREARREDLPAIVGLLADDALGKSRESLGDELPAGYAAAFAAVARDPNNRLLVLDAEGRVVGCFQLTFIPGLSYGGATRAQIESVRVAADCRNRGFGEVMMRWAIDEARRVGCRFMQLSTHASRKDAHRFYERLGFIASHVGMKLDLTARS